MHRNAQLDRRKTSTSLRHQSSTLSSTDLEDVPVIDIYSASAGEETKKTRTQSTIKSLWRSVISLNPFTRESHRLSRYDIQSSAPRAHADGVNVEDDDDVQLIALTSAQRSESIDLDSSSESSSFDSEDMEGQARATSTRAEEVLLFEKGSNKPRHAWILRRKPTFKEVDVEAYMANREMTALQEKWNALTMIPHPLICAFFIFAGLWVPTSMVQEMAEEVQASGSAWPEAWIGEPSECLPQTWGLLSLHYMPPTPVLAIALGVSLHTPWSMLYHWKYAHQLPAGVARTNHWSRRMDQAMLHFACAMLAYGASGSWDYMIATSLFNADSAFRHFLPKVAPRRNKVRLTLAIIAYSIPLLRQGHLDLFLEFWMVTSIAMWLFAAYPIGGWSHAAFHVVSVLSHWPLLRAASLTAIAQESVQMAAQCTVWSQHA